MPWIGIPIWKSEPGNTVDVGAVLVNGDRKIDGFKYQTDGTRANLKAQMIASSLKLDAIDQKSDIVVGEEIDLTPPIQDPDVPPTKQELDRKVMQGALYELKRQAFGLPATADVDAMRKIIIDFESAYPDERLPIF